MKNIIYTLAFLFLVGSCTRTPSEKKAYAVIDLAENIDKTANEKTLNDIFELERIIPLETNDSFLLSIVSFVEVNDQEIILYDHNAVYYINKGSGKPRLILNKKGRGPGEYIRIFDATLDNQDNLFIFDSNAKGKLLKYTKNGEFVDSSYGDSTGKVRFFDDGSYIVNHNHQSNLEYSISIYDTLGNLSRRNIPKDNTIDFAIIKPDALNKFNGEYYLKQTSGDTIYHVTHQKSEPYLVLDKGDYKMPMEIYASLKTLNEEKSKYIQQDSHRFIANYGLINYLYDDKLYSDIFDIETEKLISRDVFNYEKKEGNLGFPFLVNGVQISIFPDFASDSKLYCVIQAEVASKFLSSVSEFDNPVILELKLKK